MSAQTIHVLLVEDNPGDARLVREMIREVPDLDIHHVDRLAAGLEHLAAHKTDVVLLDLGLPDSQGLDSLRAIVGSGCTAPVVVLTGQDDDALGRQAVREGAQDYLVKGRVVEYALTRAVRYAIERKHAEETLAQSERKYRGLFEDAGDAIFIADAKTAIILDVNKRAEKLMAMPRQEIIGMDRADLHPKTEKFAREFAGHVEAGKVTDAESIVVDGKGRHIPVRINATTFDIGGRRIIQGIFRDISWSRRTERDLKASETRYRRLFEAAKDGILILDAETGQIVDVNPFLVELTGYSHEELLGKHLWEIGSFMDIAASKESFAELQTEKYVRYEDLPLKTRGGRTVAVEFVSNVYRVDDKKVIQCNIRDVSERKLAEEELRVALAKYKALFESSPMGITVADGTGRIVESNLMAERLLGQSQEALRQREIDGVDWKIVRPDGTPMPAEEFASVRALKERRLVENVEMGIVKARGETTWISVTAAPLPLEGYGVAIVYSDITERKRAEEALRAGEIRYRTLVDNANESIIVAQDGLLKYVNPVSLDLLGVSERELIDKPFPEFIHPDDRSMVVENYRRRIASEAAQPRYDFRVLSRDGTTKWVEINAALIEWHGRPATLNFLTDITEHKRSEEEREKLEDQLRTSQKMEAIGSLAGGIAHDFNNLLSVILSYTGFALDAVNDQETLKEDLEEVKKAGERAASLVRQLLAFSRKQMLEPKVLDLNQVTVDLEKMLHRVIGEDIDLMLRLAPDLGVTLADPGQIEQVIVNLVVNARDAMPRGGKLTIETGNAELDETYTTGRVSVEPGSYVLLAVTDNGSGMDAETLERIFEPFFTTKEKGKGTGLGLSTVYGIVRQSGGDIHVYSEPGTGTTFKVYLPRKMAQTIPDSRLPAVPTRLTGDETILVVEDEEAVMNLARRILGAAGYDVLTAASGGEALAECERHPERIHLVLTDVVMPEMGGREFAERLAKLRPGIKVLYMSGYTDDAIVHHGTLDAGTKFVGKPFNAADLMRKVREVLDET